MSLDQLKHLVIDEADLVLSYGYEDDIKALEKAVPRGVQTMLMSATLTSEVDTLKGLFCRNPVTLKLEEKEDEGESISQFAVKYALQSDLLCTMRRSLTLFFFSKIGVRRTRSSYSHTSSSNCSWSRAKPSFSSAISTGAIV